MAGGNLSPRQKMINLMYLVFIAMLALNMSKEVLSAFGLMNEKFESVNTAANLTNEQMLGLLNEKAKEAGGEFSGASTKANELQKVTKTFYDYLQGIKGEVLKGTETENGKLPYEKMDKGENLDNLWFSPEGYSASGKEVVSKFKGFKNDIKKILGNEKKYEPIVNEIVSKFGTEDVTNKDNRKVPFLDYHFKGFPAVASLAKLTAYQNDIKKLETDVYSAALGKAAIETASMKNYQAIVVLEKNAYFSGEAVKGKVVLGRYDENTKPTSFSGPGRLENGQAIISMTAGGVGEQNIGGQFTFLEDGKQIPLQWKGTYVVVPKPNQATISADKMNVVYRGLDNPMSISFAGVSDNAVNASAAGLSKTGNGKYMMRPAGSGEVVINVTAKLPDGSSVSDAKKFRIKSPPPPTGHVRGEADVVRGPAQSLAGSSVTAKSLDFDFDATWSVQSFVVKVPGQGSVRVNGSTMNGSAQAAIKKATRGDQVNITEIIATGPGGVKLKASPVVYEVQ